MSNYDYDLITIGAGSGGVRASRMAGAFGAKVAVIESRELGGTCVNVGCVPKKLMSYAAHFSDDFEDARGYGWQIGKTQFDWPTFLEKKNTEIKRLNGIYKNLLVNAGVDIIHGHGHLVDPHTVEVNGKQLTAKNILLCTGSTPLKLNNPGSEYTITSNEAFFLKELPKHITIIGAGYIACEFACIFAGMGSKVTLVHRGNLVLRGFDAELRKHLTETLAEKVDLRLNTTISKIEKTENGLHVTFSDGSTLETDQVMKAVGRKPNIAQLGLDNAGIATDKSNAIIVDDHYKTNQPHIFAIGDVINRVTLTPVALHEGSIVAKTLFDTNSAPPQPLDYNNIPTAVFTNPQMGTVGLTEEQARDKCDAIDVYASSFRPMKSTISGRQEKSFMKLIVDSNTDKVMGCHMIGPDAPEIIQGIGIVLKCGGTKSQFDATIGIHPTAAEEFVTMRTKRE